MPAADRGSASVALQPCEEKALRGHIECVVGGRKNLTDAQIVSLLTQFLPQTYAYENNKLITERVTKINPLPWRRAVAIDEPAPATNKRRKIGADPVLNRPNVASSSSVSVESSSDSDGSCDGEISGDLGRSDELGYGRREKVKINGELGDGERKGANLGVLGRSDGRKEKHNRPTLEDFCGLDEVIFELRRELVRPLHQWNLLRHLGVEPIARILLHGPPGCGKTSLARAVANEARLPLFEISAARLASRGSAEQNIRKVFSTAYMRAPAVVFIDELDAMTSEMGSFLKDIEPRIVNQLMACMAEPCGLINHNAGSESSNSRPGYVLVIGATNSPDALDPALRRRFDREFALGVPGSDERHGILSNLTRDFKLEAGFDLKKIAICTMGYLGGDLVALAKHTGMSAVDRIMGKRFQESLEAYRIQFPLEDNFRHPFHNDKLEHFSITMADFVRAGKMVQPSAKMEGFSTIPNAKWDDVGGLQSLKLEFERRLVKDTKYPKVYKDLNKAFLNAFFLCGPSGCGKTLIVEALAKEVGASFMHVKARELLKYGDQTDFVLHNIFSFANTHYPCVLFFDEVDVMTQSDAGERWPDFRKLLSVLTDTEVWLESIFVIAATNRPEIVSHSSLINSQFDRMLYVPLPSPEERGAILKAIARCKPVDADVDLMAIGKDAACENFSGADLSALMTEASKFAIDRPSLSNEGRMAIKDTDIKRALAKISPSLSSTEIKNWEIQSKKIAVHSSSVKDW